MSLSGSLRTMPVEDLLDWVDRRFACGSLTLERGTVTRSFHFDSGYVTNASSNDPSEHLGQLLLKHGLVDDEALNDAFRVQADTGVLLGKILLMVGAIDEQTLRSTLELKIRESVGEAMSWSEGEFVFEPDATTVTVSEYEVSVNLGDVISVASERRDQWRTIRKLIPGDEACFWIKDLAALASSGESEFFPGLLAQVSDGVSVGRMVLEQRAMRFDVMNELARLIERDIIAVDLRKSRRGPEDQMSIAQLESAAKGRAQGGDRTGALDLVDRALDRAPENADIQKLQRELERSLFAELSRKLLTSFRVPKLLMTKEELETIEMSTAERYLTGRIDGRWDLLSLMRVSPLREVEALITFQRLADRGIIAL